MNHSRRGGMPQRDAPPGPSRGRGPPHGHRPNHHRGGDRGAGPKYHQRNGHASGPQSEADDTPPKWSWLPTIFSIVSMTLFASIFGGIGLMFSTLAYSDHKVGDYKRARYKTLWAWFFSIFGIIFTVVSLILLFVVMYALHVPKPTFKDNEYWIPPWLLNELGDK